MEGEGLAVVISCNPIWGGGDAPGEIHPGVNRETAAEAGGNKEAASKQSEGWREMLGISLNKLFGINIDAGFVFRSGYKQTVIRL